MIRKYILILLVMFLCLYKLSGQSLQVKSYSHDQVVELRWAPINYDMWSKANKYGYKLDRLTLSKRGVISPDSEFKALIDSIIIPLPESEWETVVRIDSTYAPIALQALLGETFELSSGFKTNMMEAYNKVKENELRFGFAMYSADRSITAAKALGVYYKDITILRDEKYMYRIYINSPLAEPGDTAYIVVDPQALSDLIVPQKPLGEHIGNSVLLSWESLGTDYIGYFVERSENGKSYNRISKDLIVPFQERDHMVGFFADTLALKQGKNFYRIAGVTPFGVLGPYSDTLLIKTVNPIIPPTKVDASLTKNNKVLLTWVYEKDGVDLDHFLILRSSSATEEYEAVALNIDPKLRQWQDEQPLSSGYYKVVAVSKMGAKGESLESFVQLVDDTPPLPPQGMEGNIDSLGVVTLKWQPNSEKDLLGYRVFRANNVKGEYIQLTTEVQSLNSFVDTVTLVTLTKSLAYKLASVDKRYNSSDFSLPLVIKRPDIIPPAPPIIESASLNDSNNVFIKWIQSPSDDIAKYLLNRISDSDTVMLTELNTSRDEFIDTTSIKSAFSEYFLIAVDSAGNKSRSSNSVTVNVKLKENNSEILDFRVMLKTEREQVYVLLEWSKGGSAKQIYKKVGDGSFKLLRTQQGENKYNDEQIDQGSSYEYFVTDIMNGNKRISRIQKINVL